MNTRIVKVIIYFRQKAILFNHSITKLISFPKMLLHSYLLLKGAQYFYTFVQNRKKAEKFFSKKVTS